MWICRRCNTRSEEARKICRSCGSILEEVPDDMPASESEQTDQAYVTSSPTAAATDQTDRGEVSNVMFDEEVPSSHESPTRPDWICPTCGEVVPGNFEVCWNCRCENDGDRAPGTAAAATESSATNHDAPSVDPAADAGVPEKNERQPTDQVACSRCGSTKIMWDVTVCDQGEYSDGKLKVVVCGNPEALLFKDRLYGMIRADICGECGHIQFRVTNPSELYDHYRESLGLD